MFYLNDVYVGYMKVCINGISNWDSGSQIIRTNINHEIAENTLNKTVSSKLHFRDILLLEMLITNFLK